MINWQLDNDILRAKSNACIEALIPRLSTSVFRTHYKYCQVLLGQLCKNYTRGDEFTKSRCVPQLFTQL